MKRKIIFALLITSSFIGFSQTQTEMNINSYEELKKIELELNQVYQKVLIEYSTDIKFIENFKKAHILWIKSRDADLEMKFPKKDKRLNYGSMYSLCANTIIKKETKKRIEKLKEWLNSVPKGEGCRGSIRMR